MPLTTDEKLLALSREPLRCLTGEWRVHRGFSPLCQRGHSANRPIYACGLLFARAGGIQDTNVAQQRDHMRLHVDRAWCPAVCDCSKRANE